MKAFLAGRQAAVTGYSRQTLDGIQLTLSDTALYETLGGGEGIVADVACAIQRITTDLVLIGL